MNVKVALSSSARTFFILKKWDKAAIEFERIIEMFGDDPLIYEQLSICYTNMKDIRTKGVLEKAIAFTIKPDKLERLKEKLKTIGG